jgi:hypothetical protein
MGNSMNDTDQHKLRQPELEAEIYYFTEQEGGSNTAVGNGYRGQFYYNGIDWDAPQQFLDKEICNPGETVKVYLQTLSPDFHVGQFFIGQEFETREGAKTVGKGKITKILRPDFNYWDGSTFLKSLDKNIKPYSDSDDLLGFRMDFEVWLTETEIIADIEFEMTGNLECMMLVKCKLNNKKLQPWQVSDKIIECWKTRLATSNQLYKVQLNTSYDSNKNQTHINKFVLTFATWHSIFLTGQIIVTE